MTNLQARQLRGFAQVTVSQNTVTSINTGPVTRLRCFCPPAYAHTRGRGASLKTLKPIFHRNRVTCQLNQWVTRVIHCVSTAKPRNLVFWGVV